MFIWCFFWGEIFREANEYQYDEEGKVYWPFRYVSFTNVRKFVYVFKFFILMYVIFIAKDPTTIELGYASC